MPKSSSKPTNRYAELPVDQIACYANNPRVTKNPEYERIKNSLEKNGIESPLVVTLKPGDKTYTLQAGGNTRLNIAQSLHEAGDDTFAKVPCIVKQWTSEISVLVSHMRENDIRGNLMFIERALGVMEFARLATAPDGEPPSQRELARQLSEHGYSISQPVISAMDYAVNRLYGLLPTALEHGMGRRQVTSIRALEHCAVKLWDRQCADEAGQFADLFSELVKNCDGATFDLDELTTNVAHEISVAAELDINAVLLMLDAERTGDPIALDSYVPVVPDETRKHDEPVETRPFNLDRELQKLRSTAVEACVALADRYELSDCVHVMIDARFGYCMCELPKRNATKFQVGVWKVLATACDQTRASKRVLKQILKPESRLAQTLENALARNAYDAVRDLDLIDCGDRLLHAIEDADWHLLVDLLGAYRRMRRLADEHGLNLWKD
ncbi:MAG: ParB N-terminal domain-containing protein [Gammaproteobacteria bacterium]|nr:ParB N-terminal domain-containing protein [Gammaproteobacteria bacterium]